MMRRIVGVAILGVLFFTTSAQAQVTEPKDFPTERFELSTTLYGINDVEWGSAMPHMSWGIFAYGMIEDDPLGLYDTTTGDRLGALIHRRISGSIGGYFAFLDRFEVGLEVPLTLSQSRDSMPPGLAPGQTLGSLSSFGIRDIRVTPKIALRKGPDVLNVALLLGVGIPAGGNSDYNGDDGVSFTPEIAISDMLGSFRYAVNIGYHMRKNTSFLGGNLLVEDELFGRIGLAYRTDTSIPIDFNLSASTSTSISEFFGNFNQNYAEGMFGVNATIADHWTPFGIFGLGIAQGFGTPDWRAAVGVRYSVGVAGDPDGDGIRGSDDKCPNDPEDKDQFEDSDGCPDKDNDKDGVPDVDDGAPNDPEDKDGFQDEDGVPDVDNDDDGIPDSSDQCPLKKETTNAYQDEDGCPDELPDADGDGINDKLDKCPNNPEDKDGFEDEDGCPDSDNDGDGVLDAKDGCPNKAGPLANRGCPDADRDGDTVVDRLDNCPDEKGDPKNFGCKKKQSVKLTGTKIEILKVVYFRTNRAVIRSRSYELLRQVANVLKNQPRIKKVRVEGHTDSQGRDSYNKKLSQERAQAVVNFLVAEGVDPARLVPVGYGEERPVASNRSRRGRAANRRVEFTIVDPPPADVKQPPPAVE